MIILEDLNRITLFNSYDGFFSIFLRQFGANIFLGFGFFF